MKLELTSVDFDRHHEAKVQVNTIFGGGPSVSGNAEISHPVMTTKDIKRVS